MSIEDRFESFEQEFDLFSIQINQTPVWERIRFQIFQDIAQQNGRGQAHTESEKGLRNYLHGFALWLKNIVHRNPYFADEHEFLFIGHPRRKLEEDGYWWDIYCDPIHEKDKLNHLHVELPILLSHRTPAKTENLRYLDLIEYGGHLQRKFGFRSPSLPDHIVPRLKEAEAELQRRFDADIDVISEAQHALHVRNTTLPLYKRLLDRIDPEVAVIVVSYGKETFVEACQQKGIPTVELQHGVIYDHHFGYSYPDGETKTTFPDYLLTFGQFWNENAKFPIPDDRIIPVGYPYLEARLSAYDDVKRSQQLLFISQGTIGHELSRFAVSAQQDNRIDHEVVYKLHPGEYDRWKDEYPWLAESDVRVIDDSQTSLYRLFAESSAQVGVGSTAVYEGICFNLDTFVFKADGSDVLRPLVKNEIATLVETTTDISEKLNSNKDLCFEREQFFNSDAVENILQQLEQIKEQTAK